MNTKIILLLLTILSSAILAEDEKVIIQVNERKIGFQEFQSRLNNLPQVYNITSDELKENLVCSLIAESILAYEASRNKIDSSEQIKLLSRQYYNEALYEQWMNSEVRSKISIDDKELQTAYSKCKEKRVVEYWTFSNENETRTFAEDILKGLPENKKPDLKELEFGESLEYVENIIYNLKEGEISQPLLIDNVYYIFRLKKKMPHPQYSSSNFSYWQPIIEKKIKARKEIALVDYRIHQLMDSQKFSVNNEGYNFLLQQLLPAIYDKGKLKFNSPELIQDEISINEMKLADISNKSFIDFNDGSKWTVGEFWKKLSVCPYPLNYKNPEDLKTGLFDVIKKIILLESVAKDAENKGYGNKNYVKYQTEMWMTNLHAQALIDLYSTTISISKSDLLHHYDSTKSNYMKPQMRKIIPLVVKVENLATQIYNQILQGKDIAELAAKHSISKVTADKKDYGIFITKESYGEIGNTAFNLKPNEISPVIKINDTSFAVIKLLEILQSTPYSYEEVQSQIFSDLHDRTLQKKLHDFLSVVIKNYAITINRDELERILYLGSNMGVKKIHFPIRMSVPGLPIFNYNAKWYKEILRNSKP